MFGGTSAERDISVATGINVCINISTDSYNVTPVLITSEGKYSFGDIGQNPKELTPNGAVPIDLAIGKLREFDAIFNAMHGPFGEDGTFQAFLSLIGVPCTGSGMAASALAMDKMRARMVMNQVGLPTPKSEYLFSREDHVHMTLPVVIKPNQSGSSYGVSIVKKSDDLERAIEHAFEYDSIVIAEEFCAGLEITCAVIDRGKGDIQALPVTSIEPVVSSFFDLRAKYEKGASIETTPARISEEASKLAQELALKTHKAIGCSGVTRTDMFLLEDGSIKIIEINTLPGMTDTSLVPQAAKCVGISFGELLGIIIEESLGRP